MQLTEQEWQPIIRRMEHPNIQRNVLINNRSFEKWDALKKQHEGNYYMTSIMRALYALAITPGANIGAPKIQTFGLLKFHYSIEANGDIRIQMLHIEDQSGVAIDQSKGLYRVGWISENRRWATDDRTYKSMDLAHRWADAHSAAIVGKFDSKETAGETISVHITKAYGAAFTESEIKKDGNHFSLLWLNNEFNKKEDVHSLVSLIQNAQKQNAKIRWLIHGEGVGVFVKAVQFILDNPTSSDIITAQKGLQNQMVYFSNPRGKNTSKEALKTLCEKAGFHYINTNVNMKDVFGNEDARDAALKEVQTLIAKFSLGGAGGALGLTTIQKNFETMSSASTTLATIGFGVSGYIVGKGIAANLWGYAKSLPGAIDSTFGSGNASWAE